MIGINDRDISNKLRTSCHYNFVSLYMAMYKITSYIYAKVTSSTTQLTMFQ